MQQTKNEPSLGDLFGDLARDMGTLVSQEITLARTSSPRKRLVWARISRCWLWAAWSPTPGCLRSSPP
jgi:hypothetical protein